MQASESRGRLDQEHASYLARTCIGTKAVDVLYSRSTCLAFVPHIIIADLRLQSDLTVMSALQKHICAWDCSAGDLNQSHGCMATSLETLQHAGTHDGVHLVGNVVARAMGERGLPSFLCTPPYGL